LLKGSEMILSIYIIVLRGHLKLRETKLKEQLALIAIITVKPNSRPKFVDYAYSKPTKSFIVTTLYTRINQH
jgi:hypothetical protein